MKKTNTVAMLLASVALSAPLFVNAQANDNWRSSDGSVWKNGTNELCWRNANWTPATADPRCDGALKPPAPAPAPKVDPADMESLATTWSEKYAGRISIYDYYLPVMGLAAISEGIATAGIAAGDLEAIGGVMSRMRASAASVAGVVAAQTALATGEVDIVVGGGEWLTAVLAAEQPELTWTIPKEGAVRWAQSIGVVAGSEKPDLALEFVKYIVSAEGQARLATSSCFWGMPANAKAGAFLTDEQKATLRWDDQADYLARTQLYPAPDAELDAAMQDLWLETLAQ